MNPGAALLIRNVYDGRVRSCYPCRYVGDLREGDAHSLDLFWDEGWAFLGWYVNLQAPVVVHGDRIDTTDRALDVWVEPDGARRWKDEDDFEEAQKLGIIDAAAAAEIRAEGERVIAEHPWPTGWENWRAPAEWEPPILPEDWDSA